MATPSKRKSKPAPPAPAIVIPPGAPSTATCGRCQDQFQLTQNHATACFGHLADDPNHDIDCDRVFKVGYEGSVYKMGCCGKLFPSNSCDTPDLSAEWSPDLAGIFEEEGEQIFRGLCQKSLNAGIGGAPHVFKDYDCATCDEDFGSADEQAEYMGSLPEGRRPSPGKLKQLKARFSSEDKRYSESSAVAMVRRSGGGGGGVW